MHTTRFARLRRRASLLRWVALGAGATALVACDDTQDGPLDGRPVASVEVSPATFTLPVGESRALAAALRTADGTPLSGRAVAWSSDDESLATVDATGKVTAHAEGTVVITATSEGRQGRATVSIPARPVASLTILADSVVALAQGRSVTLIAIPRAADGTDLNGKIVTWSTSDESVAWVSTTGGVVAGAWGEAVVTAEVEGVSARVTIRVLSDVRSVEIDPAYATAGVGEIVQLTATARTDGGHVPNKPVTWASEDETIATVVNGRVTGRRAGSTYVTATLEGKSARSRVDVVAWEEYRLESVDGTPLPVTVLEGTIGDPNDAARTYRWTLTEGVLRVLPMSRYERRFTFRIHIDGAPDRTETMVERGALFYDMIGGGIIFESENAPEVPEGRGWLSADGRFTVKQQGSESEPEMTYLFRKR